MAISNKPSPQTNLSGWVVLWQAISLLLLVIVASLPFISVPELGELDTKLITIGLVLTVVAIQILCWLKVLRHTTTEPPSAANSDISDDIKIIDTAIKPEADPVDFAATLDRTTFGLVVMNDSGTILYANRHAPVRQNIDEETILELVFDGDNTIEKWLKDCRDNSIRSQKNWQRISNKLVGEDERKIYDISASYEKGDNASVVIAFVERTGDYIEADNALNFIAFAAHELRGPITVVRGYIDTLQDELADRLRDDEPVLFQRLVVSSNRLSSYINNILNAAKYDRRHLKVHLRESTVASIYDTIAEDMAMRAQAQGRMLSVNIPSDLPTIAADQSSLSEVIGNLIDNGIKYSSEGGVVTVEAEASGNSVKVSVKDNGIGMPSNVMSNLFHKFYRSHRSRETVAGTGIGLYICKAIVDSHGGTIDVNSIEGQGSTFTVSLPTYISVADKLESSHNSNEGLIKTGGGWIKNHGKYRG